MLRTILVVADDPLNRKFLEEIPYSNTGVEWKKRVDETRSPYTCAWVRADPVLLDVQMPFSAGFEVCHRPRTNPGTRPTPSCGTSVQGGGICVPLTLVTL